MKEALNNYKAPQSKNEFPVRAHSYMQFEDPETGSGAIVITSKEELRNVAKSKPRGLMVPLSVPVNDSQGEKGWNMHVYHFRNAASMGNFLYDLDSEPEPVTKRVKNALVHALEDNLRAYSEFGFLGYIIRNYQIPRGPSIWSKLWSRFARGKKGTETATTNK